MSDPAQAPLRLGMLGFSPGNGHPFSFSAILNGYDDAVLRESGWGVIADYLALQDPADIGTANARVTACWAPDNAVAQSLARACHIDAVMTPAEMLAHDLDGVIVARDDWRSHADLAMPFLRAGLPVFVDKPLTLSGEELDAFTPYLESGLLMSCSALRYARELDPVRAGQVGLGRIQMAFGAVPLTMDRYGIHVLDALSGALKTGFSCVHASAFGTAAHAMLRADEGYGVAVHALGDPVRRFRMSVLGTDGAFETDILDNFSAFRRCLLHFLGQIRTRRPAIDPNETVRTMRLMMDIESRLT